MLDEIHPEPPLDAQIAAAGPRFRRAVDRNDPIALGLDLDHAAAAAETAHTAGFLARGLGQQTGIGQVLDRARWADAETLAAIVALGVAEIWRCRLPAPDSLPRPWCKRLRCCTVLQMRTQAPHLMHFSRLSRRMAATRAARTRALFRSGRFAGIGRGARTVFQRIFLQRAASRRLANALQAALRLALGGFVVKTKLDFGKSAFVVLMAHMARTAERGDAGLLIEHRHSQPLPPVALPSRRCRRILAEAALWPRRYLAGLPPPR